MISILALYLAIYLFFIINCCILLYILLWFFLYHHRWACNQLYHFDLDFAAIVYIVIGWHAWHPYSSIILYSFYNIKVFLLSFLHLVKIFKIVFKKYCTISKNLQKIPWWFCSKLGLTEFLNNTFPLYLPRSMRRWTNQDTNLVTCHMWRSFSNREFATSLHYDTLKKTSA